MRSLLEIPLGNSTVFNIGNTGSSSKITIPDDGHIVSIVYGCPVDSEDIDVAQEVFIFLNNTDTTERVTFPITAVDAGGEVPFEAPMKVEIGDNVYIRNNAATATTGNITFAYVLKRDFT